MQEPASRKLTRWMPLVIVAAVIAALGIFFLVKRVSLRIKVVKTPVSYAVVAGPLRKAVDAGVPEAKFEDLVTKNPGWIDQRYQPGGAFELPVLADCVLLRKTNYVKILIQHGADLEAASDSLEELGLKAEIQLLTQMEAQVAGPERGFRKTSESSQPCSSAFNRSPLSHVSR